MIERNQSRASSKACAPVEAVTVGVVGSALGYEPRKRTCAHTRYSPMSASATRGSLTWPSMFRAVRFRGRAVELTREEVAGYFDQRPYGSRLSAWASDQSAPIPDRAALEARWQAVLERFGPEPTDDGADAHGTVPVPDFWGGYRIVVDEVELWGGRRSRLHDRIVFERIGEASLDGTDAALDDAASWRRFRRQP